MMLRIVTLICNDRDNAFLGRDGFSKHVPTMEVFFVKPLHEQLHSSTPAINLH